MFASHVAKNLTNTYTHTIEARSTTIAICKNINIHAKQKQANTAKLKNPLKPIVIIVSTISIPT